MKKFENVKVGDTLIRMLAGKIPVPMQVTKIDGDVITMEAVDCPDADWTFDMMTGAEIDDYLNWGPPPKMTGSFIKFPEG